VLSFILSLFVVCFKNLVQLVSHDESIAEDDELDVHYKRNLIKVQECCITFLIKRLLK
jgi:hypothetical protein